MGVAALAIVALVLMFLSAASFMLPREAVRSVGSASPRPWDPSKDLRIEVGLARLVPQQEGNSRKTGDREGAQRRQNA